MSFWDKVQTGGWDECWLWLGAKNKDGYGNVWVDGKCMLAHRAVWEREKFAIGEGLYVLHRCDNPSCVNPNHLFLGTQKDNVRDCAEKGRRNQARYGPRIMKLSLEERAEIQRLRRETDMTQKQIGEMFGVRPQTVSYWEKQA